MPEHPIYAMVYCPQPWEPFGAAPARGVLGTLLDGVIVSSAYAGAGLMMLGVYCLTFG